MTPGQIQGLPVNPPAPELALGEQALLPELPATPEFSEFPASAESPVPSSYSSYSAFTSLEVKAPLTSLEVEDFPLYYTDQYSSYFEWVIYLGNICYPFFIPFLFIISTFFIIVIWFYYYYNRSLFLSYIHYFIRVLPFILRLCIFFIR